MTSAWRQNLATAWARTRAAFGRLNPRERMLLGLAALGVVLFAPVQAYEWMQQAQAGNIQAREDLETTREAAAAGQGQLRKRLKQAETDVRDWSWSAPSVAAGQVVLVQAVNDAAIGAGLAGPEVKAASDAPVRTGDIYLAKVELQSGYDPQSLAKFIQTLNGLGNGFMINTLTFQNEGAAPRMRVVLELPLNIQPESRS